MNIAFSAIIIIMLLLPGALFLRIYQGSAANLPRADSNFAQNLAAYISLSLPVHIISLYLIETCSPFEIHLEVLLSILVGWFPADDLIVLYASRLVGPFYLGLFYVIATSLLGLGLGWLVRKLVTSFYLDLLFPLIRPQSDWFYIFSGEILSIEAAQEYSWRQPKEKWLAISATQETLENTVVFVSVLVPLEDKTYLYRGYLYDYQQQNNELVRITLTEVLRRPVLSTDPEDFYAIPGDYLALDVSDFQTLNFEYLTVEKT